VLPSLAEAFLEHYNAWREGRQITPAIRPATTQIAATQTAATQTADPADGRLAS